MRRKCEAHVTVAASPETVWAVISDVTRVGEWSGECRGCVWVGDADAASPGARFRGRNRRAGFRWTRLNEIVVAQPPHTLVWRTVPRVPYPDSVEWRLTVEEGEGGTLVSESFEVLDMPRLMEWAVSVAVSAHRDRSGDLAEDLARLKTLVESGAGPRSRHRP